MMTNTATRHRRSIRLRHCDYAQSGAYFLTLCTHNRQCLFGEVIGDTVQLNELGLIVADEWLRSSEMRTELELDEWVVMPNHLHAIALINATEGAHGRAPLQRRARLLPSFVAGFKAATTTRINRMRVAPGMPVWQRNYYEHVVRNEASLDRIRRYIVENPLRWADDEENPANVRPALKA